MNIIIRKPKFMRNDLGMADWINIAETISKEMARPEMTLEQQYTYLRRIGYCMEQAAKAGGFFSVKDFHLWMNDQIKHTT